MPASFNRGKELELKMYDMKNVPKFCFYCGEKMKKEKYFLGFNGQTCEKEFGTVLFCPKYKFKFLSHLTYSFSSTGKEIIERY